MKTHSTSGYYSFLGSSFNELINWKYFNFICLFSILFFHQGISQVNQFGIPFSHEQLLASDSNSLPSEFNSNQKHTYVYKEAQFNSQQYDSFESYIAAKVKFPRKGSESGQFGLLKADFIIHADGSMGRIEFLESPGQAFEQEVRRVLLEMPQWTPALYGSEGIESTYKLRVRFTLH